MNVSLRGIYLTPEAAIAAASRGGELPVCITPRSGREFYALAADPEIRLPLVDPESGARYTRVMLEACR